ncbi:radical SAM protein [uncultured Bilophila sp.]|uniref:radical SAM protein n=1 Tax=uncultured Bilophila sp. TaxID=529385 RepID=UPI0026DD6B03|nr:radical SAM protein [uncultured Bilophila sp.]
MSTVYKHVYGPVPSRRLGRSLGVDALTFKSCSFDCVYCQLGRTTNHTVERREYVPTAEILDELRRKLAENDRPEYISFAGSGEPTLHSGLGEIIRGIKAMTDVPVVVFTNGSLLWKPEVRADLRAADVVIPSLDGGDAALLDKVNRPEPSLSFDRIVEGLVAFRDEFPGRLWLEVMLLGGVSDDDASVDAIARIAERIRPDKVQINSVCRPPAESWALPVSASRLLEIRERFALPNVEIIAEHLDDMAHTTFRTQIREEDILALIERRPCTAAGVAAGLNIHVTEALKHLEMLVADGKAVTQLTDGQVFYSACELREEGK